MQTAADRDRALVGVGGALSLLAVLLEWIDAGFTVVRGYEGIGLVLAPLGVVLLAVAVRGQMARTVRVVVLGIAAGVTLPALWTYARIVTEPWWTTPGSGLPGVGIWVALGGGVVGGIGASRALVPDGWQPLYYATAFALVTATVVLAATGGIVTTEPNCMSACVPQAALATSVSPSEDTISLDHDGGARHDSARTRVELGIGDRTIVLNATAESAAFGPGDTVTFALDGSGVSAPWAGYGPLPVIDITPGERVTVWVIHEPTMKVIYEETVG